MPCSAKRSPRPLPGELPLRAFLAEALADKLRGPCGSDKPWMQTFGKLRDLHAETTRIDRIIEAEFGQIEPEDRE